MVEFFEANDIRQRRFENPPENLTLLAFFVVRCYAPCWFDIKRRPLAVDGSWNFWNMVRRSRFLPAEYRTVVDKALLRNSYWAHFENVLLGMLGDSRESVRQKAIAKILEIRNFNRNKPTTSKKGRGRPKKVPSNLPSQIRRFNLMKSINFSASDYVELVEWDKLTLAQLNEPPLTMSIADDKLCEFKVPEFPSNSQATERCVRLVTEASGSAFGEENRDLIIRSTVFSREINSCFSSKSQYNLLQAPS